MSKSIATAITKPISNRSTTTLSEKNAEEIVLGFRQAVADFVNADPLGVVYGRSWTQITYDFSRTLAKTWKSGDEIIVTTLDHDSNVRPWVQAAEAVGAVVRWAKFDPATGELVLSSIEAETKQVMENIKRRGLHMRQKLFIAMSAMMFLSVSVWGPLCPLFFGASMAQTTD